MYSLSLVASFVACLMIAGVNSAVIKAQVGKNPTGQLDTVFNPNQVTAQVGDMIQFEFMAKNYTTTQSSFAEPCTQQFNTALNIAGANSAFMPVAANATEIPTFTIQVNDASSPQWFFCNQANHCDLGKVFSINAPTSGNHTFDAFLALAKTANHPDPALNQTAPFTPPPPAAGAASFSDTSSPLATDSTDPYASSSSSIDGGAPSPSSTDAPANVAPGDPSSNSSSTSGYATDTPLGLSLSSSTGTGTAAQDQGTGSLSGSVFLPSPTASSSAGTSLRLRAGGGSGRVELGVMVGVMLGTLVL